MTLQVSDELALLVNNETNVTNVNIDTFVLKAKKWALTQIVDKRIQSYGCAIQSWSTTSGCGKARILVLDKLFSASSEQQAIIDACEYIRIGVSNGYN